MAKNPYSDDYLTPRWVWEPWHQGLNLMIDAAAGSKPLPCCVKFYTKADDAFKQNWAADLAAVSLGAEAAVWCNPPYSRTGGPIIRWVRKALEESAKGIIVVMLLPADTSTDWFSLLWDRVECCWRPSIRGYFIDARVKFLHPQTGLPSRGTPTFGSLLVLFGVE